MRKLLVASALVLTVNAFAVAQRPEGAPGGPGGPGGGRGFMPPNPLLEALDTNKDGEISAEEIANAVASLKALDKNGDGKLTGEEIRPAFRGFGQPGGPGTPGGPGGALSPEAMLARWMEQDKNGDGKLSAEELGDRGPRMLEAADTNKDGLLDKAELEAYGRQMMERFRGGQGGPGGRGNRPPGEGGARPEGGNRPQRPEA